MSYDHAGAYLFTGNFPVEIADHGEYYLQNFREKPSVVAKGNPQGFWKAWSQSFGLLLGHAT
jgi:hypothetical protein